MKPNFNRLPAALFLVPGASGNNRQQRTTPACTGAEETGPHRKVRAIFISGGSEVADAAVDLQLGADDIA